MPAWHAEAILPCRKLATKLYVVSSTQQLWACQNTHAVLLQRPLAGLNRLPFSPLHVGDIYQRFSGPDAGTVQNVIEFSVPSLLSTRPAVSGTFVVDARYTVSSSRRIALTFSSANLRECPR
jgi:hypothetical protein